MIITGPPYFDFRGALPDHNFLGFFLVHTIKKNRKFESKQLLGCNGIKRIVVFFSNFTISQRHCVCQFFI